MTLLFFNLLTNATMSLLAGLLICSLAIWFFRIGSDRWKIFLLSIPFIKIVFDFLKGVPENSILRAGIDPFLLPSKHQTLQVSIGWKDAVPKLSLFFTTIDLKGKEYSSSLGDYFAVWLNRRFGPGLPLLVVVVVAAIAFTLFTARVVAIIKFERGRRAERRQIPALRALLIKGRSIDVYVSDLYSGSPFTGGILRPYICIPRTAKQVLTEPEMQAVLEHEQSHILHFDLVGTFIIQVLGDLFWFVPGYHFLSQKIDGLRELEADRAAVRRGAEPALLASALLKLSELENSAPRNVLYSAFFRKRSLLKTRIEVLIGRKQDPAPRFGWRFQAVRIATTLFVFVAVMIATFGGNHSTFQFENSVWLKHLLNSWGLS